MAATPYKIMATFRGRSGQTYQVPISADDVAGNRLDFDQTGTEDWIAPEQVELIDLVSSADGVDTKKFELYVNGQQTTYVWFSAMVKNTIPLPRIAAFPVIATGARVQFYQRA